MKESRYVIEGHRWHIRFAEIPDGLLADADTDQSITRDIRIHPNLLDRDIQLQVDAVVHELIHVQQPDMDEEYVERRATEIARVLCDQFTITEM